MRGRSVPVLGAVFGTRTMLPAWLGALVLSFAWLHALPVYFPATGGAAWFAGGILLLVLGCRGGAAGPRQLPAPMALLLGVGSIAGAVFLPRPYDVGPLVLLSSAVLAVVPIPARVRRALLPGLWTAGIVLVLQAALLPLIFIGASRLHEAPFLTPFVYLPLKLLAPGTIRSGATLHMLTAADSIPLTPSWDKLAIVPAALLAAGSLTLLLLHRRGMPRLASFVLLGLVYAWARLVILFLLVSRFRQQEFFWNLDALFTSFVPWVLAVAAWWSFGADRGVPERESAPAAAAESAAGSGFRRRAAVGALLLAAGCTFFWGYQDPGRRKAGRILIDEGHSDWEWTTQAFDTEWYGGKSGYNYYCLADYWKHFYDVETRREPLTPALLSRCDVLVIKTPTSAYTPAEVDAVADFVRAGGGLFLVGDHTNVFGSSTYLNPIASRFGLYFRYDATYRLDNLDLSIWSPPPVLPHPVVRDMGDFLFATSCSLDSPLLSENVILGYGLRTIYLDYAEVSYFPEKKDKMDDLYPLVVQSAGVRFGKGRVLGFTDSTVFSNFFMFIPGKAELALGSIEWLNRTNRHGFVLRLALLAGFAGLVLLLWDLWRGPRLASYCTFVPVGLLVFTVVASACQRSAARAYAPPAPRRPVETVVFDGEHGFFGLPLTSLMSDHWSNMHTFYVWMQRIGLVPRRVQHLKDALDHPGAVLVEINPVSEYSVPEIDRIVDFVSRGGALLVLDTPLNLAGKSRPLLGAFSMSFAPHARDSLAVIHARPPAGDWLTGSAPGDTLAIAEKAFGVNGATPLATLADGTAVLAERDFGRGKVVACGVSTIFGTTVMGNTGITPTPRLRSLYQLEYDLLERIARTRAVEPRSVEKSSGGGPPAP